PHFAADIRAVVGSGLDIVNLPKPESPDDVRACARALAEAEREERIQVPAAILVNIESPRAYRLAAELATASPRVIGLQAGWGDLIEPLDIDRYNSAMIEAEASRRLGYLGKSCIHPTQIALANDVFRPTDVEIAHSLKVVEAARDAAARGVGAFTVNGKMVDAPFVRRAEAILALARKLQLIPPDESTLQ